MRNAWIPSLLDLDLFYKLFDKHTFATNNTRITTPFGILRRTRNKERLSATIFETHYFDAKLIQKDRVLYLDISLKKPFEEVINFIIFGMIIGDIMYLGCSDSASKPGIVSLDLQLDNIDAPRNLDRICKKIVYNYKHLPYIKCFYECAHGVQRGYREPWSPLNQICEVGNDFICFLRGNQTIDIYRKTSKKMARLQFDQDILAILGDHATGQLLLVKHSAYYSRSVDIIKLSSKENDFVEGEGGYVFMHSTKKVARIFRLFCQIYQMRQLLGLSPESYAIRKRCYLASGIDREHKKYLLNLHFVFNEIASQRFPRELTQKIFWLIV